MIARRSRRSMGYTPHSRGGGSGTGQGHPRWRDQRDARIIPSMDAPPTNEAPHAQPTPDPARLRTLCRSADDRVLGGVAGGIAANYGIDPVLVRLAFLAATFLGGLGAIA